MIFLIIIEWNFFASFINNMILLAHMLLGAAIGAKIHNPYLAILLALLGHYFLDLFPHIEYSIDNIKSKDWKKTLPDVIKVFIDFSLALLIIFLFSNNQPLVYVCALVAIIPDGFTLISSIMEHNILKLHDRIHTQHIHYLTKQKKFPVFWKISTQFVAIIICTLLLR